MQFTASAGLKDKLERLRALMRTTVPDGDLAAIIETAVTEKLQRLEARRFGSAKPRPCPGPRRRPKQAESETALNEDHLDPASRRVPAAVRQAVWQRDGGRCRYVDASGRRCSARERLEFHHRHPYGYGGDVSIDNVSLLCHTHNQYLADIDYGTSQMEAHRRRAHPGEQNAQLESSHPGRSETTVT